MQRLQSVHPDLVKVVLLAAQTIDFQVICGARSGADEAIAVKTGHSETSNSRHLIALDAKLNIACCHAVDLLPYVNGAYSWKPADFAPLAAAIKETADETNVKLIWGGDWRFFKDYPHFELTWAAYPSKPIDPDIGPAYITAQSSAPSKNVV